MRKAYYNGLFVDTFIDLQRLSVLLALKTFLLNATFLPRNSVRLCTRVANHFRPLGDFRAQVSAEFLGRIGHGVEPKRREAAADILEFHSLHHLGI